MNRISKSTTGLFALVFSWLATTAAPTAVVADPAAGDAAHAAPARVDDAGNPDRLVAPVVSCLAWINRHYPNGWLQIRGTHVQAAGVWGTYGFTMADGYQIGNTPLNTPAAVTSSVFDAYMTSGQYSGYFHEVIPTRSVGVADRWQFSVTTQGHFWLRWAAGNVALMLQNTVCYGGPADQLVVTGTIDDGALGSGFWTFLILANVMT